MLDYKERFRETRDILEALDDKETIVLESIENITTGIEDIFIAEVEGKEFNDEEIAHYAKEITKVVTGGIVDYLHKNYSIKAVFTKRL